MGEYASSFLSSYLGADVTIKKVNIGLLNQIILQDISINTELGENILFIDKASTNIELLPLFKGDVILNSVQLFGMNANISRSTPDSPLNIQFIIDKLKSKKTEKEKTTLKLSRIIIRNSSISYNIKSSQVAPNGLIDFSHLEIKDLNTDIFIHQITANKVNININKLRFRETKSGLSISELKTNVKSSINIFNINDLYANINNSQLTSDHLTIITDLHSKEQSITGNLKNCKIFPSDFSFLSPKCSNIPNAITLNCDFSYNPNNIKLNNVYLRTSDENIYFKGDVNVLNIKTQDPSLNLSIKDLNVNSHNLTQYLSPFNISNTIKEKLYKLGKINIAGNFSMNNNQIKAQSHILSTTIGELTIDGILNNSNHRLKAMISSKSLNLKKMDNMIPLANTSLNLLVDLKIPDSSFPEGIIKGEINHFEYNDLTMDNIHIDGSMNKNKYSGYLSVHDKKIDGIFDGIIERTNNKQVSLNANLSINNFKPASLWKRGELTDHSFTLNGKFDILGSSLTDLNGNLFINNLKVNGNRYNYDLNNLLVKIIQKSNNYKNILINSELISGNMKGYFSYNTIYESILASIDNIAPLFGFEKTVSSSPKDTFDFKLTLYKNKIFQELIDIPVNFNDSINFDGSINGESNTAKINIHTESLSLSDIMIQKPHFVFTSETDNFTLTGMCDLQKDNRTLSVKLNADGHAQMVKSNINWILKQEKPIRGSLNLEGTVNLNDAQIAHVKLLPSEINIFDQLLNIQADYIDIYKNHINFNDLKAYNQNRSVEINGTLSSNPADSIIVNLDGTTIENALDLLNTNAPNINGLVYGKCKINNILESPQLNANLYIDELSFKNINLGHAFIIANWDNRNNGICINTNIINDEQKNGITSINGYIYPNNKSLDLTATLKDTNSSFLNSLLFRPFKNITGKLNGDINVFGPFNAININGSATTDSKLTLRATNVTYNVNPEDTIQIRTNSFIFDNIRISDKDNTTNILNGIVSHEKFKNFSYEFDMHIADLLLYDESNFNSDKFKGKIYANGTFNLKGSDGHPLYITSELYPSKESEFVYDASTPDAITTNTFISFREINPTDSILVASGYDPSTYWHTRDSLRYSDTTLLKKYKGDIYMNLNIHMNHNCAIKLKMENVEDGYITTLGTGILHADYHNKGGFSINGTYKIQEGKYRLYLQDIIYRDLIIQDGSNVVFNGNPFDADIHLICWHTLQSVPLSDLTSAVYTQNNKVRVRCILDITGHLGNMNFNFDLNLPNVSDETRQIVKSYISTDEEMNKQIIYLLGFGRFYTNDYARVNGENNTNQAVNSLLSSTLSGQINQLLSNAIGNESKWNFGTGISTGERGWEDVDLEGTLSGKLLDDRLLINGNFGYRDNSMTNNSSFIGDFDVRWRLTPNGNTYLKAYNLTNDRYFTKSTLNTQGIGATYQKDFESWRDLFKSKKNKKTLELPDVTDTTNSPIMKYDTILFFNHTDTLH